MYSCDLRFHWVKREWVEDAAQCRVAYHSHDFVFTCCNELCCAFVTISEVAMHFVLFIFFSFYEYDPVHGKPVCVSNMSDRSFDGNLTMQDCRPNRHDRRKVKDWLETRAMSKAAYKVVTRETDCQMQMSHVEKGAVCAANLTVSSSESRLDHCGVWDYNSLKDCSRKHIQIVTRENLDKFQNNTFWKYPTLHPTVVCIAKNEFTSQFHIFPLLDSLLF